jgi:hypothetical protein
MNCHFVANSLIRLCAGNRVASVNKCKKPLAIVVEAGLRYRWRSVHMMRPTKAAAF